MSTTNQTKTEPRLRSEIEEVVREAVSVGPFREQPGCRNDRAGGGHCPDHSAGQMPEVPVLMASPTVDQELQRRGAKNAETRREEQSGKGVKMRSGVEGIGPDVISAPASAGASPLSFAFLCAPLRTLRLCVAALDLAYVSSRSRRHQQRWCFAPFVMLSALLSTSVFAQPPLPAHDTQQHLGPATCASSVCHGRANADDSTNVMQHEYRVWTREDPHSRAYTTLLSDTSKAMARRLGIGEAHEAKVCLDCHADNVPVERRGEQFQLTDGVGCEACHGGAGEWIRSHAEAGASHADNLAKGLFPTPDPAQRARLCLSCHMGTEEKFAGHDMMAAGHPRLTFELAAFTANQPAHFIIDDDYIERKGEVSTAAVWAQGLVGSLRAQIELLRSPRLDGHGLFPELGMFDCHSCHHPMDDVRWTPLAMHRGLPAGAVRLNDGNLVMAVAVGQALSPQRGAALEQAGNALHRSTLRDRSTLRARAAELLTQVEALQGDLADRRFEPAELRQLRGLLLARAGEGKFRDFAAAEQAFLAVETLSIELGEEAAMRGPLDRWFATLRDEHRFNHRGFAAQAASLRKSLN